MTSFLKLLQHRPGHNNMPIHLKSDVNLSTYMIKYLINTYVNRCPDKVVYMRPFVSTYGTETNICCSI